MWTHGNCKHIHVKAAGSIFQQGRANKGKEGKAFSSAGSVFYRFAADRLAVHVSGRWDQGLPVSSFVIGDERRHFAIDLLVGQEDAFDPTYLENKVGLQQLGLTTNDLIC